MGQVNVIPVDKTIDVNDIQELTDDEKKIISEQDDLFRLFYTTPFAENYWAIRQNDKIYRKGLDPKVYQMFVLGMKTHNTVGDPLTEEETDEYNIETERLLDLSSTLTVMDLDILWILYYATGDIRFPDRVKTVVNDTYQDLIDQEAAQWSYESHANQGLL